MNAPGLRLPLSLALLSGLALAPVSVAQVASALLKEGDAIGPAGHVVTSVGATAANQVRGYAVQTNTSNGVTTLSHFWGTAGVAPAGVLRTEGVVAGYTQSAFESFFGMSDSGSIAYSPTVSAGAPVASADCIFVDNTPVAIDGEPAPAAIGDFWSFGSRPGMTAAGDVYWCGGVTTTPGSTTTRRGLYRGNPATPVLVGGQLLTNLPSPLSNAGPVDFDVRFSPNGLNYACPVLMLAPTTADRALVVNGQGVVFDGIPAVEGNIVPASMGGQVNERWTDFDITGITDSGTMLATAITSSTSDVLIINDRIVLREGDTVGGQILSGGAQHAYLANNGTWAVNWNVFNVGAATIQTAIIVNGKIVLQEGSPVDLDGNGVVEPNSILVNLTGGAGSPLSISVPGPNGSTDIYFTADIDTAGTTSTSDDISAFMKITVPCYANCDGSTLAPILNPLDFSCFLTRFRAGEEYANCDGSTVAPTLNALDFSCFLNQYLAGCR